MLTDVEIPGDPRQLAAYFEIYAEHAPTLERLSINSVLCTISRRDDKLHLYLSAGHTEAVEVALAGLETLPPNLSASSRSRRI